MTFYDSLNTPVATNAASAYLFKETMKLAGWTVTASSDGTTYNGSGDQITLPTGGAGGMDNNNAWFILQQPTLDGYQRWIGFQLSGGNRQQLRSKISWTGFSTAGNASTMNSSADEKYLFGSSVDYADFTVNSTSPGMPRIRCGDADEKYHFYWVITTPVSGGVNSIFTMDYVDNTHALDFDKYVYYVAGSTTSPHYFVNSFLDDNIAFDSTFAYYGWCNKHGFGIAPPTFYKMSLATFAGTSSSNSGVVGRLGTNPYDNKPLIMPAIIQRVLYNTASTGPFGIKGQLRNTHINTVSLTSCDTLSLSTSKDKICFGALVFSWDGSNPII